MNLWKSLTGMACVEIRSADITLLLQKINDSGIELNDVTLIDELTAQAILRRRDFAALQHILQVHNAEGKLEKKIGIYWLMRTWTKRQALFVGLTILIFLALFIPTRVFFIKIEGNMFLPSRLILEKAEDCGVVFGASRRDVRSEQVKNALIEAVPELQWAGINTYGCVAVISVKEKTLTNIDQKTTNRVSSIIASRDGIIVDITVLKGNPLCRIGEAVKAGQTLVSGYTDCGLRIYATDAEAEILAQTFHELSVVAPHFTVQRGVPTGQETKYSLLIGKKLINFYQDSGISGMTCVKMYNENYLTLPGGWQLPIALIREQWVYYDLDAMNVDQFQPYQWIEKDAQSYLKSQMVAGRILLDSVDIQQQPGLYVLHGQYSCLEMIGQVKCEENLYDYGESNGENR